MRSLQEAIGRQLAWKPRSLFSHTFDLVDPEAEAGEPYATLVMRAVFALSSPSEAQSGDGTWRFRHRGFFRTSVFVLGEGADRPLATLRQYWRRAVLRTEDGREFVWRRTSFWSLTWRFEDANGTPVVVFPRRISLGLGAIPVEIDASAAPVADRALLSCLGCYLLLLARRRHAARGGG